MTEETTELVEVVPTIDHRTLTNQLRFIVKLMPVADMNAPNGVRLTERLILQQASSLHDKDDKYLGIEWNDVPIQNTGEYN